MRTTQREWVYYWIVVVILTALSGFGGWAFFGLPGGWGGGLFAAGYFVGAAVGMVEARRVD